MYRYQKQNAIASDKTKTPAGWPGFVCVVPLQAGHAAMKTGVYPRGKLFMQPREIVLGRNRSMPLRC